MNTNIFVSKLFCILIYYQVREEADPRQPKLGVRERVYVQKLIAKYGTNYKVRNNPGTNDCC